MKIDQIINESYQAFFAPEGLESDLKRQLKGRLSSEGRLILASPKQASLYFLQNRWESPRILSFKSEVELRAHLKSFRVPAYFQPFNSIKTKITEAPAKAEFLKTARPERFVEWTYLDQKYIMVCEKAEGFPLNDIQFIEDKSAPSRAYLKLWELFTRIGRTPKTGETCLDLGSAPGGWTYVLEKLNAKVTSVDRADLEGSLANSPNVVHMRKDAFSVKPGDFEKLDWLFSDLICFPAKLAEFIEIWLTSGVVKNFVCTLKFKGPTDWESIARFEKLGGELIHLSHNKHELTWYLIR